MTAATSGRSLGTCASPSTIDAIVSTSYGVRFLLRAYERSSLLHFDVNSASWFRRARAEVDLRSKLYVSGKRKPSSGSFLRPKPGIVRGSRSPRVRAPREPDLLVRLVLGDLRHGLHARRHLRAGEPLGEDDPELPQLADRRRRRRRAAGPAAARGSRRDQHGADAYERAARPLEIARKEMRRRERVLGRRAGGLLREVGREALVEELDGDVDGAAQRVDEALGLGRLLAARRRAASAGGRRRSRSASSSRTSRASSASPLSLAARSTTQSGRASVPVGSETATPVRAEP